MNKIFSAGILCCFLSIQFVYGQKTIVILGSSTAAGNGASVDSSWAARLQAFYRKNNTDGVDTTVINLGYPGFVTYQTMPSGFIAPPSPDRTSWPPDTLRNVTRAELDHADIVIINLPSNDVNLWPSYNMKETMDNFRNMFQNIMSTGARCYITTTQPRNDMTDDKRLMLRELVDSINNNFGMYAIDFWDDLVTSDGLNMLRTEVNADNIHPNNLGHRLIFERVANKNIFVANAPLPISLLSFTAQATNDVTQLQWTTAGAEMNSYFDIERSSSDNHFIKIGRQNAIASSSRNSYSWTDQKPLDGINQYRLKIAEPGNIRYSAIISIDHPARMLPIQKIYYSGGKLMITISTESKGKTSIYLTDASGAEILTRNLTINERTTNLEFPVSGLARGIYLFTIALPDGTTASERFMVGK